MPAFVGKRVLAGNTVTPLNTSDAAVVGFANLGQWPIRVLARADATLPTVEEMQAGWPCDPGCGDPAMVLADKFKGVTSPVRLFAWSLGAGEVVVNHG